MAGRGSKVQSRSGVAVDADLEAFDQRLRQRRWRILRAALPQGYEVAAMPLWITAPDQFLGWIAPQLPRAAGMVYFAELERIAKQTGDLDLLRLARRFRACP
jgi:hypothetical protein